MAETDILTATENYGKARTAFALALDEAARARTGAMIGLGADITTQTGTVLSPEDAGAAYKTADTSKNLTMRTGFGEGALPTIAKEQVATVAAQKEALAQRGIEGEGGLLGQQKVVAAEAGTIATQEAVQEAQAKIAEAAAAESAAEAEVEGAKAVLDTTRGKIAGVRGKRGAVVKATNRGAYTQKVKPRGTNLPKKPKPGQSFTGAGGVTSVYRPKGPQGAGWYKKKK